jgi:hypothetical protein
MKPSSVVVVVVFAASLAFVGGRMSAPWPAQPLRIAASMTPRSTQPWTPRLSPSGATGATTISGRVAELIQVPSYTYLRLETSTGDTWSAISTNTILQKGDDVTLANATAMHGFSSPTLKRSFETIYFAQLATKRSNE